MSDDTFSGKYRVSFRAARSTFSFYKNEIWQVYRKSDVLCVVFVFVFVCVCVYVFVFAFGCLGVYVISPVM